MNPEMKAKLERRNALAMELGRLRAVNAADMDARDVAAMRQEKDNLDAELDAYAASRGATGTGDNADVRVGRAATVVTNRATEPGARFVREDGRQASVARGQSFADHPIVAAARANDRIREEAATAQFGGVAQMVRSLSTTGSSGVVPIAWASEIIDVARNNAAVLKAGAQIIPMDTLTLNVGRLTADPTAGFRTEGSSITPSDPTFDNVTLTAKTLSCLVVGSMEFFADAPNADQLVTNSIGKAMALQLDKVALYGGITSGAGTVNLPTPPNPRGVLAALNAVRPANVVGPATNGTVPTNYNEIIDLDFLVENLNETPNGLILPVRLAQKYAKLYDTLGQPMRRPDAVSDFPWFTTAQIPSYTQGTMTNVATDAFIGDWTELLIGQRMDFTIQILTERYADLGQLGIVATWRGDVQPARTSAFAVSRALGGA